MKSNINIQVHLAEDKMPEMIEWNAPDGGVEGMQKAKALLLGLWDGEEKSALRIDLWTAKMMVDEMNDFTKPFSAWQTLTSVQLRTRSYRKK